MSSCLTFPDVLVTVLCREMCNSFPYKLPTHNCSSKRFFLNVHWSYDQMSLCTFDSRKKAEEFAGTESGTSNAEAVI